MAGRNKMIPAILSDIKGSITPHSGKGLIHRLNYALEESDLCLEKGISFNARVICHRKQSLVLCSCLFKVYTTSTCTNELSLNAQRTVMGEKTVTELD